MGTAWRRSVLAALLAVVALSPHSGCVSTESVVCGDGSVCPADGVCVVVDGLTACATPAQVTACAGLPALAACGPASVCHGGACFPVGCGNQRLDPGEPCDDGNNVPGDGCAADCASDETCGNGVVDLVTGEQCDDGPAGRAISHDGCASDCTRESVGWTVLPDLGLASDTVVAYDARRDRIVMFGSTDGGSATWESDGHHWMLQTPPVSPARRLRPALAYDAHRQRVVLFGGLTLDDTWEWDGATWTLMAPTMSPPSRDDAVMAYDPIGERIVLSGGFARPVGAPVPLGDTWTYDGVTWTLLSGDGPSPRGGGAAMAFDPTQGALVLTGGWDGQDPRSISGETWALAGATWTLLDTSAAAARHHHTMGFEPRTGRLLMQGGSGGPSSLDTWAWTGVGWTALGAAGPAQPEPAMVTVVRRAELLLVTRATSSRWDVDHWTPAQPYASAGVDGRSSHMAAVDLEGRRMVIYGGHRGANYYDDTLIWNGAWSRLTNGPPGQVFQAELAYDQGRRQFVMFGGRRLSTPSALDETWLFDGTTWAQHVGGAVPPGRAKEVLVYDAARGQTVMFGGIGDTPLGDTWIFDGVAWTQAAPVTSPGERYAATAAYDPIRSVVVVFGGTGPDGALRDTWEWDGASWTLRATGGPTAREYGAAAWDPARRRVVLFGGNPGGLALADQWEWDGAQWTQVPVTTTLRGRADHALVTAIDGAGVLAFGGTLADFAVADELAWLRWDGPAGDDTCGPADSDGDSDGDGLAGCDPVTGTTLDPDCWLVCRPACPPGASGDAACGATAAGCGDRVCAPPGESCVTCPVDCGACAPSCGDFQCTGGETATTCPGDCA
ncbi:MAG: hypothetical protein R3B06_05940 [Kofleriaceae bacterium]